MTRYDVVHFHGYDVVVIYKDGERRNHQVIHSGILLPASAGDTFEHRTLMCTYSQWKARWGK